MAFTPYNCERCGQPSDCHRVSAALHGHPEAQYPCVGTWQPSETPRGKEVFVSTDCECPDLVPHYSGGSVTDV